MPLELWEKAACVMRWCRKSPRRAAFIVGGEYGKGLMSCRQGSAWSAPIFIRIGKGKLGSAVWCAEPSIVMLVMANAGGVEM
ncbi:MAG: hypothetical protein U0Q11_06015 [Vicinamibacterales bacterium]